MKINELIHKLIDIKNEYGDIEVLIQKDDSYINGEMELSVFNNDGNPWTMLIEDVDKFVVVSTIND